jgi:hypothetical protein
MISSSSAAVANWEGNNTDVNAIADVQAMLIDRDRDLIGQYSACRIK